MKKIACIAIVTLLFIVLRSQAGRGTIAKTALYVENLTNETFLVAIRGTNHGNSKKAVSLEPGERRSCITRSAFIRGPMRIALIEDVNKPTYHYFETPKSLFPIMSYQAKTARMISIRKTKNGKYIVAPRNRVLIEKTTTKEKGF